DGDCGGLAGLARAVEQLARVVRFEDLNLPGVGLQTEAAHHLHRLRAGDGEGWGHGHVPRNARPSGAETASAVTTRPGGCSTETTRSSAATTRPPRRRRRP